ncbi:unnamed protein product [Vicia faba]|uniref:Uncharacterized protein n=1 Tax=Vicia faba TaxID=3906 RepID=A0AAV0YUE0_VICFA|nr:unnamed protein product [Vicia faba]
MGFSKIVTLIRTSNRSLIPHLAPRDLMWMGPDKENENIAFLHKAWNSLQGDLNFQNNVEDHDNNSSNDDQDHGDSTFHLVMSKKKKKSLQKSKLRSKAGPSKNLFWNARGLANTPTRFLDGLGFKVEGFRFGNDVVYASTNCILRRQLWDSLTALFNSFPLPWYVIGDFNAIVGSHEHKGMVSPSRRSKTLAIGLIPTF